MGEWKYGTKVTRREWWDSLKAGDQLRRITSIGRWGAEEGAVLLALSGHTRRTRACPADKTQA